MNENSLFHLANLYYISGVCAELLIFFQHSKMLPYCYSFYEITPIMHGQLVVQELFSNYKILS
jgi:hypothetical protein